MAKFTRHQRLVRSQEFQDVFQSAKRISTEGVVLLYKPNKLGRARLGLAISKKYVPKAVRRNQIKRIIRETFRKTPNLGHYDFVVMVRERIKIPIRSQMLCLLWGRLVQLNKPDFEK